MENQSQEEVFPDGEARQPVVPGLTESQYGLDDPDDDKDADPGEKENKIKRAKNAEKFKKYLTTTGLPLAFQVIFAEILAKKIDQENVYSYTAMR